jgi:hypothetical protein
MMKKAFRSIMVFMIAVCCFSFIGVSTVQSEEKSVEEEILDILKEKEVIPAWRHDELKEKLAKKKTKAGVLYKKDDLTVTMDTKIVAEYNVQNFTKKSDSLFDSKSYDYWDNYINFGITAKATDWKARFKVELSDMSDDAASVVADGEDGELEIEEAFLNYRFPDFPFFFQVGRWGQSFGTEMFYGDTNDTGVMLGFKAGDILTFSAGNFTLTETKDGREDHDMSFIRADAKFDKKNKLSVFLVMAREDTADDINLYNLGINYKGKIDNLGLELEGNKQFGSYTDADGVTKIDYEGYAMMGKVSMKMGNLKPGITLGYGSGDDDPNDKEVSNYVGYSADYEPDNIVIDEYLAGTNDTISNLMFARLDLPIKATDKLTITPCIGYYKHVEDVNVEDKTGTVVGTSDKIGTEIDLGIKYKINKYISFKFAQGYLLADNGIGIKDPDNAWKTEAKVTVKF